jgi:MFS transporter, UMF1 family
MAIADIDEKPQAGQPVSRKGIWGWMFFDWAAQPFHTLIVTFVFAPYFAASVAPDPITGQEWWGYAAGIGGLLIAILSPVLGALSDATGPRKPWIFGFSMLAIFGVWSLWFMVPDASDTMIIYGLFCFVLALIGFEFASVFNNAMMPGLVSREKLGALSGNAWALGYAGGLLCLIIVLGFMAAAPETGRTLIGLVPVFGFDPQQLEGDRAVGPMTALWYLIFIIPMFLYTPDTARRQKVSGAIRHGLGKLFNTLKTLPKQRSLFAFLCASMFYRDALNGLYIFGGIYARGVLGWSTIQIGVFGILANFFGIFGCILGGMADNRIGTKAVVSISILTLICSCTIIISTGPGEVFFVSLPAGSPLPDVVFYIAGCLIGAAGGALQASSRPLLVDQVRPDDMGEAFGLYALSGRATAFLAPISIAFMTSMFSSQRVGITPILVLFAIGLLLLIPVKTQQR